MKLRKYVPETDFDVLRTWITDERMHAMWCANRFPYPLEQQSFEAFLKAEEEQFGNRACTAENDDGKQVGFYCFAVQPESREALLKFVIIDNTMRGRGCGSEMVSLAVRQIFEQTDAKAVSLAVFSSNIPAKQCYLRVGFTERSYTENAFCFGDEHWSRYHMIRMRPQ